MSTSEDSEIPATQETREAGEALEKIEEMIVADLRVGDGLTMVTVSESVYRLAVTDSQSGGVKAMLSRANSRGVTGDTDSWESIGEGAEFEVRGCCTGAEMHGEQLVVRGHDPARLRTGSRAVFGLEVKGDDKTLVTSTVRSIFLARAR